MKFEQGLTAGTQPDFTEEGTREGRWGEVPSQTSNPMPLVPRPMFKSQAGALKPLICISLIRYLQYEKGLP